MDNDRSDVFDLARFLRAQEEDYDRAMAEIRSGRKRTHWMWYVFPQIDGLGVSQTARYFSIKSLAEADAYLRHPVLGPRLISGVQAVLDSNRSISELFGAPDDMKLRSCAALFAKVSPGDSVFAQLLDRHFGGMPDQQTLDLLERGDRS